MNDSHAFSEKNTTTTIIRLRRLGSRPKLAIVSWMKVITDDEVLAWPSPLEIAWIVGTSAEMLIASAKPARMRQNSTPQGLVSSAEKKIRITCFM